MQICVRWSFDSKEFSIYWATVRYDECNKVLMRQKHSTEEEAEQIMRTSYLVSPVVDAA